MLVKKDKSLAIIEKEPSVNIPMVAPEHSVSHHIQAPHTRNYGDHITIVNQKIGLAKVGTTSVSRVVRKPIIPEKKALIVSPVRLPPRMIKPAIHPVAMIGNEADIIKVDRSFDDMMSFLISFFNDPFMWLGGPTVNRDLWQRYINESFSPTFKILKEHFDKTKDNFRTVEDIKRLYLMVAGIISDAARMSLSLQTKVPEHTLLKLNHYFVSEWADLGLADYFVGLFNDYLAGRISRDDLNSSLGGNLSEIEQFLGEKL